MATSSGTGTRGSDREVECFQVPGCGIRKVDEVERFRSAAIVCAAGTAFAGMLFGCSGPTGGSDGGGEAVDTGTVASRSLLETTCVEEINRYRASVQLAGLEAWADSAMCFSRQAALDIKGGKGHANFGLCKESAQNTCPGWSASETVESQVSVLRNCLRSMWNEGPGSDYSKHGHYTNMTNSGYRKVGCGFAFASGSLWINMDFK